MSHPSAETTIVVNGFALREIRVRSGIGVKECAEQAGISRAYLTHLELGSRVRVSPRVFAALQRMLHVKDRRALLAWPHDD